MVVNDSGKMMAVPDMSDFDVLFHQHKPLNHEQRKGVSLSMSLTPYKEKKKMLALYEINKSNLVRDLLKITSS